MMNIADNLHLHKTDVMRMCGGYLVETKKWKAVKSGRIMQTFRAKYSMNPSFILN